MQQSEKVDLRLYVQAGDKVTVYEDAVALMDDEIREELHAELAPCSEQDFFDAYRKRHSEKYDGEDFLDSLYMVEGAYFDGVWAIPSEISEVK